MRLVTWLCLIGGLGCVLAACGSAPVATGTPAAQFKQILFDSFENNINSWNVFTVEGMGEGGYDEKGQQYRIKVTKTNAHVWSNPTIPLTAQLKDVTVSVEAENASNVSNNLFGVICRYKNEKNFYFLMISSDGYFGIGKVIEGQYQLINRNDYPPSSVIDQKQKTQRIRAECVGTQLSLYVDDQLVDRQTDADLIQGGVGLIAATLGGETVIDFDNFEVKGP